MMATRRDICIDLQRLMTDIRTLASIGARDGDGIARSAFSQAYQQAGNWLSERMQAAGLETRIDAVGNVIGRMGPVDGPVVMTGSHIDTVRSGGPLDGALGVLAGLEVARVLKEQAFELASPYEVVSFVDEEGAYLSLMGSMAMAGTLSARDLEIAADCSGTPLRDAMREYGFEPGAYREAVYPPGAIQCFVELHIEQGPVLENRGLHIGMVDGIVSQRNVDYRFFGRSNHAGTTPMDMRRDAFRAAAEFVSEAYKLLECFSTPSSRMTFGSVSVKPNASNVIPREATVRMDQRDLDEDNSARLAERVARLAGELAERFGLRLEIEEKSFNPAALLAPELIQEIQAAAEGLGYRAGVVSSGAGHDAQSLAGVCDTGMIFVPSIGGLSHHPDEWTAPEDLERGANVLLHTLLGRLTEAGRVK